ncbi:MAG: hypothetical protein D6702_05055 [Planctomycetota bacterium]|nr:MAG: hypothetical protein D6702_05055 [Planctomycetota bacterium]
MRPGAVCFAALALLPGAARALAPSQTVPAAVEPFPEPERGRLVAALADWIRAVEQGDEAAAAAAAAAVGERVDGLARLLGRDPLAETAAWTDVLAAALGPASPPPPGWHRRRSSRFGQDYRLFVPADPPAGPRPLLVLLGIAPEATGDEPADSAWPPGQLVLRLDLPSADPEQVLAEGRRRLLDALAEVLRLAPVDRNRIHLVARPGAGTAATLLGGTMPHFFDLVALAGPGHWWAGWPWQESVRRALRSFLQVAPHTTLPGLLFPTWPARLDLSGPRPERSRQVQLVRLLHAARDNLLAAGGGEDQSRFLAFGDLAGALAWCETTPPRRPDPASFEFAVLHPAAGRAWWAQATSFEPDGRAGPSRFRLRADRERNRLEVRGSGVHSLDLYLNDRLLDLERPIEIRHLGSDRIYRFQARRSLTTLLENFARNPDPWSLYPAMIRGLDLQPAAR